MTEKPASLFGKPVDLDDKWISKHKDHSLCWMTHTVFDREEKTGRKFRVCICYTCGKLARKLLEEVSERTIPGVEKNKRAVKGKKKRFEVMAFGGY